ncbi:MAG: ABC transporter substrate-binding protein [Solirubrobacterales bacterium]|nr:ABC transporter substrate-binding protein [Solirubrobacterales bacterium]
MRKPRHVALSVRRGARLVMLGLAVVAPLAGCGRSSSAGSSASTGTSSAPGVTDRQITIGSSYPLSGPLGPNGQAAAGGAVAEFDAVNAEGGVKMSDGQTRKIRFTYYDDGYDPAKALQNFNRLLGQNVFALFQTFGTAPSIAIMKQANAEKVPQIFVHAGDLLFSDNASGSPWTIGWSPSYEAEGKLYGGFLAAQHAPLKVGVLRQADTLGQAYLTGFKQGISGSQVKIVGEQTYIPTDPTVDSQIAALKAAGANVLFMAVAIPPLMIGGIQHAETLGWHPKYIIMISLSSSINQVLGPGKLTGLKNLYSAYFLDAADNPKYSSTPAVQQYLARMKQYAPGANPYITNAEWGYGAAETFVQALQQMKPISRRSLMSAVRSMQTTVPLLASGLSYNGSSIPPVSGLKLMHFSAGEWQDVSFSG